jgi:hypothetical protein
MSSSLTIPEARREGFVAISSLTMDVINELTQCLEQIPASLFDPDSVVEKVITAKLKLIDEEKVALVVETALTLFSPLIESGKPIQEFLDDLIEATNEAVAAGELNINEDGKINLRDNLFALLTVPSIGLSAKATSVLFENERSVLSSKLISEVRPIFGIEEDSIGGAVIVHTLRLEYFAKGDGCQNNFYIQLDDSDLDDLIFKLERAKNKSLKIKEMLRLSSTPLIDGEG